jgi:SAM-dependent methyltransferase
MGTRYRDLLEPLRIAYDRGAEARDRGIKEPWKQTERAVFLERLRSEGTTRLLEIGAGTGQDSAFFRDENLDVVATDLSPAMVERCRAKGLDARVMDFMNLDFPAGSFDAAYAVNCLLHVPNLELPAVLGAIRTVLRPGGVLFVGVYGGESREGVVETDKHDPKRFFAVRTDDELKDFVASQFEVLDFHTVDLGPAPGWHFQSVTARRPS